MLIFTLFNTILSDTKENGIFSKNFDKGIIVVDASGSSNQEINGSMQLTKPEYSTYPWNKRYDWCSNCGTTYDDHPWITYSIKNKRIKINSYFVRVGCCYNSLCCCEDYKYKYCVHCCLYSWSLQVSNDNKTWTEVHRMKDEKMRRCKENTYNLDKTYEAKYVRLIQNEACPGDPLCIALNKFELFGDIISEDSNVHDDDFVSYHDDDDDDVSIIGHISKNGNVKFN